MRRTLKAVLVAVVAGSLTSPIVLAQTGPPPIPPVQTLHPPPSDLHSEKNWKQICADATFTPLATPIFDPPETEDQLKSCDETALYYGYDRPPDPHAALQCAWYQRAHPIPQRGDPFYGPGTLTMLYANGMAVDRNYHLAIRFACENTWAAEAEMEYRVGHLEYLRDHPATTRKLDLCDDGTSGLMMGACASVQENFADVHRRLVLKTLSRTWSPQTRQAFQSLQQAEDAFEKARSADEVDLSGTGRGAFVLYEQGRLRDQFLINLHRFSQGTIPAVTPDQAQAADRKLNDVYQQLQTQPADTWTNGTIKPEGIRRTEEAWLKLRAQWIAFGRLAYPNLSPERLQSQLTHLRIHQLQSLLPK